MIATGQQGGSAVARRIAAGILIILVAATTFYGVNRIAISQPAEPTSTPEPGLGLPRDMEYPVVEGDGVDLSKPLAEPVELPIAGYIFVVPKGATVLDFIADLPVVDAATGDRIGDAPLHPRYSLISRGNSSVKVDNETGQTFEWNVKPQDLQDFEPLRRPRPAADAATVTP
jgi:hypothetical protein